jgi:hypothetical protein
MLIFSLGLTDTEINYAFQLIPQPGFILNLISIKKIYYLIFFIGTAQEIISNHPPSFLHRFLSDLTFAGFLVFAIQIIKQLLRSVSKNKLLENKFLNYLYYQRINPIKKIN